MDNRSIEVNSIIKKQRATCLITAETTHMGGGGKIFKLVRREGLETASTSFVLC